MHKLKIIEVSGRGVSVSVQGKVGFYEFPCDGEDLQASVTTQGAGNRALKHLYFCSDACAKDNVVFGVEPAAKRTRHLDNTDNLLVDGVHIREASFEQDVTSDAAVTDALRGVPSRLSLPAWRPLLI